MKESTKGTGLTKQSTRTVSSKDPDAAKWLHKFAERKLWGYDGAARGTVENLANTLKKRGLPNLNQTVVIDGDNWRYLRDGESEIDAARTAHTACLSKFFESRYGYQSNEWYAGKIIELSQEALDEQNIPAAIELGYLLRELHFKDSHESDTIHGRHFKKKRPDAAIRQRKRDADGRRQVLIDQARKILDSGEGRFATGKINFSDLAETCLRQTKENLNIGKARARNLLKDAADLGEL